jgi:arsenical-resistance protein 2
MAQSAEPASWWEAFPEFKASCPRLEASEVKELLEASPTVGNSSSKRNFLLVDVRRTDWEGGTVTSSINLPAHTFYQTRPVVYQLCKQAGIETVIFYCGKTDSR